MKYMQEIFVTSRSGIVTIMWSVHRSKAYSI